MRFSQLHHHRDLSHSFPTRQGETWLLPANILTQLTQNNETSEDYIRKLQKRVAEGLQAQGSLRLVLSSLPKKEPDKHLVDWVAQQPVVVEILTAAYASLVGAKPVAQSFEEPVNSVESVVSKWAHRLAQREFSKSLLMESKIYL